MLMNNTCWWSFKIIYAGLKIQRRACCCGYTPFEALYGYKPKVHHFGIFGLVAYALIPTQHRTKLDDKSVTCIVVGYSLESKEFNIYDPITRKVIINKDVGFTENEWMQPTNVDLPLHDDVPLDIIQFEDDEMDSP